MPNTHSMMSAEDSGYVLETPEGWRQIPENERLVPDYRDWKLTSDNIIDFANHKKKNTSNFPVEGHEAQVDYLNNTFNRMPSLDEVVRVQWEANGITIPDALQKQNLALRYVEQFRSDVHDAQALRRVVKKSPDVGERALALRMYAEKKESIQAFTEYGPIAETAYREYLKKVNKFVDFNLLMRESAGLRNMLFTSTVEADALVDFTSADDSKVPGATKYKKELNSTQLARVQKLYDALPDEAYGDSLEVVQSDLDALETIYSPSSKELEEARQQLLAQRTLKVPKSITAIQARLKEIDQELEDIWADKIVQSFHRRKEFEGFISAFERGDDVVETQTVIKNLNTLHRWELEHPDSVIRGVLIGPPGVGKTTLARHYEKLKGREYVYIDMSEEVTRYTLYGSKSIQFERPADYYKKLASDLEGLSPDQFKKYIEVNSKKLEALGIDVTGDAAIATMVGNLGATLSTAEETAENDADKQRYKALQTQLLEMTNTAFLKELGNDFSHIVHSNGWKDGIVLAALRRGAALICDEFPQAKNWSAMYSLMTASRREKWKLGDNDTQFDIPEGFGIWFTGNIGKRYGSFQVPEAFASRVAGRIMNLGYPPHREETLVGIAAMSDREGKFLRSGEDQAKLAILIKECFPGIRAEVVNEKQSIPVSYRLLKVLSDKLVIRTDPHTRKPVYRPTETSFDQALYETFIESYGLFENSKTPVAIAKLLVAAGLLLDDSIRDKVEPLVGSDDYKAAYDLANKKDTEDGPAHKISVYKDVLDKLEKGTFGMTVARGF